MGLGPPVCMKCVRIFEHLSETERDVLLKDFPDIGWYWCSWCKNTESDYHILTVPSDIYEECIRKVK